VGKEAAQADSLDEALILEETSWRRREVSWVTSRRRRLFA